jgi:hypothetical protein
MPDVYITRTHKKERRSAVLLSSIRAAIGKIKNHPAASTRQHEKEKRKASSRKKEEISKEKNPYPGKRPSKRKEIKYNKGKTKAKSQHSVYPYQAVRHI